MEITFAGTTYRALFGDLIRSLTPEERADLKAAIEKDGVRSPVLVDEDDGIIDGINRLSIAAELGLSPYDVPIEIVYRASEDDKQGLCLRMNTARRQMSQADIRQARTNAEKRTAVRAALLAHPEKSDSAIAREVGVDHKTVAAARRDLGISQVERIGADGRTINTSNIGKRPEPAAPPPAPVNDPFGPDEDGYVCKGCGEEFNSFRWHCLGCGSHWQDGILWCGKCHKPRYSHDEDEALADGEDDPTEQEQEDHEAEEAAIDRELAAQAEEEEEDEQETRRQVDGPIEHPIQPALNESKAARSAAREQERRESLERLAARAEDSDRWEIRLGDCASGMHHGLHGTARLVFADPPYNIGWDYGDGKKADLVTPHHFLTWCKGWLEQVPKVLTPDGSFWLLISDEYAAEVKIAAEDAGLYLRQWLIWYEAFGVNTTRKFNRTHRHLLHFVMDESEFVFNPDALEVRRPSDRQEKYGDARAAEGGKLWDSVWGINPPIPRVCGTHREALPGSPAPQLPLSLLKPIIAVASDPGDLVLDPFCGNATTGVAALQLGRRFLGWELREPIHELATLRMRAAWAAIQQEEQPCP